ncbi:hypothetical protein K502DRAFT_363406 [Neoconidiobolus thromboides FSU 785]|nr:hypothetical protein K502DRAFT_363406 [Neoconidiobolus thromboides FSU 785]
MNFKFLISLILLSFVLSQVYDDSQRGDVCDRNLSTCIVICYNHDKGQPLTNTCDPNTFNYECVCAGDYRPPLNSNFNPFYNAYFNIFLDNTLPAATAKCQIEGQQCKAGCNGAPGCAEKCNLDHICLGIEERANNNTNSANSTSTSISLTITAVNAETSKPSIYSDTTSSSFKVSSNFILCSILTVFSISFYQI